MSRDCEDGCGEIASERLRYFTGRHMTARDFVAEQAYHRTHRLLHNRLMHGWGVVCGLHVSEHNADCNNDFVKVSCGFALDCCGREIPVPKDVVPPPLPWKERPTDHHVYVALLCLDYCETPAEPVPVLYGEQDCDPQRREYGRVRESYGFSWHWVRVEDLPRFDWKTREGGCPERKDGSPCPDDDCEGGTGPKHCCLEPQCPPHHCVPLAIVRLTEGPIRNADIDMLGRPSLEPPQYALTHICHINWPHGGVVRREDVEKILHELRVSFDRRLRPAAPGPCGPSGVSACTFVVQYGGGTEDLDFVPIQRNRPPYVDHDCVAVYAIGDNVEDASVDVPYDYLEGHIVYITLKCDFILDCHGVAVDGNHIGGLLPSGDGVRGGTFESWFRVATSDEWQKIQKQQQQQEQTT